MVFIGGPLHQENDSSAYTYIHIFLVIVYHRLFMDAWLTTVFKNTFPNLAGEKSGNLFSWVQILLLFVPVISSLVSSCTTQTYTLTSF